MRRARLWRTPRLHAWAPTAHTVTNGPVRPAPRMLPSTSRRVPGAVATRRGGRLEGVAVAERCRAAAALAGHESVGFVVGGIDVVVDPAPGQPADGVVVLAHPGGAAGRGRDLLAGRVPAGHG